VLLFVCDHKFVFVRKTKTKTLHHQIIKLFSFFPLRMPTSVVYMKLTTDIGGAEVKKTMLQK